MSGANRHAPEGYKLAIQFFQGETKQEALNEAAIDLQIPIENLIALTGHFNNSNTFGWMVFRKKEWYD